MDDNNNDKNTNNKIVDYMSNKSNNSLSTGYHNLPSKVLLNIFKNFNEQELQFNIMPVCQNWKYVALTPELWKKLVIYGNSVPIEFIMNRIRKLKNLETIYLKNISDPNAIIKQICRCNPYLLHLALRDCPTVSESALLYLIKTCTYLESLDLNGTNFSAKNFFRQLHVLPYLRSINLSNNPNLKPKDLLAAVSNCRYLEELHFANFITNKEDLRDDDVIFIISLLYNNLTGLSLDASTLSHSTFKFIMKCYKLKKLGLYGAINLHGYHFRHMWKYFPELIKLRIHKAYQINGKDVEELFTKGRNVFNKITHIDLTAGVKITDNGILAIGQCCKKLKVLIIKACKSLKNINEFCILCDNIHTLSIAYCYNLDLNCLLLTRDYLKTLIIDEEQSYSSIIKKLRTESKNINIYVNHCEYNKNISKM